MRQPKRNSGVDRTKDEAASLTARVEWKDAARGALHAAWPAAHRTAGWAFACAAAALKAKRAPWAPCSLSATLTKDMVRRRRSEEEVLGVCWVGCGGGRRGGREGGRGYLSARVLTEEGVRGPVLYTAAGAKGFGFIYSAPPLGHPYDSGKKPGRYSPSQRQPAKQQASRRAQNFARSSTQARPYLPPSLGLGLGAAGGRALDPFIYSVIQSLIAFFWRLFLGPWTPCPFSLLVALGRPARILLHFRLPPFLSPREGLLLAGRGGAPYRPIDHRSLQATVTGGPPHYGPRDYVSFSSRWVGTPVVACWPSSSEG
jgi:hypothetical protein